MSEPYYSSNSVGLPTGVILVVRHAERYGAIKAIDQAHQDRGGFIRYVWWYQPDGSGSFINPNAHTGYGDTRDYVPAVGERGELSGKVMPRLYVGPIELQWSMSDDGYGFGYFGPPERTTEEAQQYEMSITDETDISKVRTEALEFVRGQSA